VARLRDLKEQLDGANERIIELEEEKAAAAEFRAIQPEALRLARECQSSYDAMRAPLGKRTAQAPTRLGQQLAALVALLNRVAPTAPAPVSRGGARVFAIPEPRADDEARGSWGNAEGTARPRKRQGRGR
jgi:hypothetical protein